jgi:hypothetical protein
VPAVVVRSLRKRSRAAALSFIGAVAVMHLAALLFLDEIRPGIRDPEYGRRVRHLRHRLAEDPARPSVLVIGSSRTAMGVRPSEWEGIRPAEVGQPDPLMFNMSLLGSGPLMELMVVNRLLADGIVPGMVLFEYWPPFFSSEKEWEEPKRIAIDRLSPVDDPIVQDYFTNAAEVEQARRQYRWNPIHASRERLLAQVLPPWLPQSRRQDWAWHEIDPWGWKPGPDVAPGLTPERETRRDVCQAIYKPIFDDYRISPMAERAMRQAVATMRGRGVAVGLVYLPESSEFRGWYPPAVQKLANEHLAKLSQELDVPVIDARMWMNDEVFVDGFHLTRIGAAEFTRRLGPAIAGMFQVGYASRVARVSP